MALAQFLFERFTLREDAEHKQIVIRFAIVTVAMFYFHSDFFADRAASQHFALLARWAVSIAFIVTVGLFLALMWRPGICVSRRLVGMLHDVTAISTAMFLGQSASAAVAAIYLWVTLGNGFRYGVRYLYACAALSFLGFGCVFVYSEYWRSQPTLSANIFILLAVVPPYVASLLKALHVAKAQLSKQATIDGLTGLMNRPQIKASIAGVLQRQHDGHVLLFCDLDHFKNVNDVAGHAAGDKVLSDVGEIIHSSVRGGDLTARLGGDEFCVLLKNCPLGKAREIAENIRNRVSGYRLAWSTQYFSVGISIGAAPSAATSDMASLFRLADAACYAAKNAGRNQVHVVDPQTGLTDTQSVRRLFIDQVVAPTDAARTVAANKRWL